MNIAYIIPSLVNQGPIVVVNSLVNQLSKRGFGIDVYYFDELDSAMTFACPTHKISMNTPINFDDYDIIHSHCFRPDRYVCKWKYRIKRAKIVSTLHQDTYQSFYFQFNNKILSTLLTWYWCRLQSKFDGVVSISNQLRDTYRTKIKAPLTTIYNGCSDKFIIRDPSSSLKSDLATLSSKYKILGMYAYITKRKGVDQVLNSLVELPDYAFVIIGEGPYVETLKAMCKTLDITERTYFLPYQSSPRSFLKYFDVYVMPSYSEGFGLAVVEAALSRKAIVCSNIPSFNELFGSDDVSFFELKDIESLSNAIQYAYKNRKIIGERAFVRASATFTEEIMADNHSNYYQSLIQQDRLRVIDMNQ